MTHPTTPDQTIDPQVHNLVAHFTTLAHAATTWAAETSPDLAQLEQHILHILHDLGAHLLTTLTQTLIPDTPAPTVACPCGASAAFERLRPTTCRTLLGPLTITRPYYLCPSCHHGFAPTDQQLGWCPGGRSAALDELLALLGATQESFAQAASVLERLSLVHLAPNTLRSATHALGDTLTQYDQHHVADLQAYSLPSHPTHPPSDTVEALVPPLCISLDGVLAHLRPEGWKELCVGAVYEVIPCRPSKHRRADAVRATTLSYVAELGQEREAFGWQLYAEAMRRGAATRELVVIGDGAAWLWSLADLHFPEATRILDWFHATEYVWGAAKVLWGEAEGKRTRWAERQLRALWKGRVGAVIGELERHGTAGKAVREAATYFTNQQDKMDYPRYRARGLPIGSGAIESGCKQMVSGRLKGAGMRWEAQGAQGVVKIRAWQRSGRWDEAMALRSRPQRQCRRKQEDVVGQTKKEGRREAAKPTAARTVLPADVLAKVREELAQKPKVHPWRTPGSEKRRLPSA